MVRLIFSSSCLLVIKCSSCISIAPLRLACLISASWFLRWRHFATISITPIPFCSVGRWCFCGPPPGLFAPWPRWPMASHLFICIAIFVGVIGAAWIIFTGSD